MENNSLQIETKEVLIQLIDSLTKINLDDYNEKLSLLSNSSIGEHTRHIIELFQCLNNGYDLGSINYDNRKRDLRLQSDIDFAIQTIAEIIESLNKTDKSLSLNTNYDCNDANILTTYNRELLYNLEHCIHHQAIIKIGLIQLNIDIANENFGVAKSTILYKNNVHS